MAKENDDTKDILCYAVRSYCYNLVEHDIKLPKIKKIIRIPISSEILLINIRPYYRTCYV